MNSVEVLVPHQLDDDRELCAIYGGDVLPVHGLSFPEVEHPEQQRRGTSQLAGPRVGR